MGTSIDKNKSAFSKEASGTVSRRSFVAGGVAAGMALALASLGVSRAFGSSASDAKSSSAASSKASSSSADGTKTITDCAGREVEVPADVKTCIAIHPMACQIAFSLVGIDGLLAIDSVFQSVYVNDGVTPYYTDEQRAEFAELPVTSPWMKGADEEQLLSLAPDVIFTLTQDSNADQLQQDIGIPVIALYKSPSSKVPESLRVAGEVLNKQDKAEEMATWWEDTFQRISDDAASLSDDERPTVMYVGKGGDIMGVPGKDSVYGSDIALAGCISVSDEIEDTTSECTDVTMEQMMIWDPDYIVCQTADERDTIYASEEWSALSAVENGNVLVPLQYCSFDGWYSVLGTDWLNTTVLHPDDEDAQAQLKEDMTQFYKLFHNRDMSEEDLEMEAQTW